MVDLLHLLFFQFHGLKQSVCYSKLPDLTFLVDVFWMLKGTYTVPEIRSVTNKIDAGKLPDPFFEESKIEQDTRKLNLVVSDFL